MELITQCNKILIYEGNGYDKSPYVEPAHEVNHSAIAALLAQSKSLCAYSGLRHRSQPLNFMRFA